MIKDSIRGFARERIQRLADTIGPRGSEINSGEPVDVPLGYRRPPTLDQQIQRLVRDAVSRQAAQDGFETFEEADDFDVGDDYDPTSPYEMVFDPAVGEAVPRSAHSGLTQRDVDNQFEDERPIERTKSRFLARRKGKGDASATPPAGEEKPIVSDRKQEDGGV